MRDHLVRTCYCHTCDKPFHPLGVMRHRAMHRDREEDCEIGYSDGTVYRHLFSRRRPAKVEAP